MLKLRRLNLILQLVAGRKTQIRCRFAGKPPSLLSWARWHSAQANSFVIASCLNSLDSMFSLISSWHPAKHSSAGDFVSSDG
jgi:hypothetical protein